MIDIDGFKKQLLGDITVISMTVPKLEPVTTITINGRDIHTAKLSVFAQTEENLAQLVLMNVQETIKKLDNTHTVLVLGTQTLMGQAGLYVTELSILAIGD